MAGKKKAIKSKRHEDKEIVEQKKLSTNDKIRQLEEQISNTKYNKKTQHAIGLMKAKLAMLKEKAANRSSTGKASGDDRFSVRKSGDATVVLLGFPSVGKSTLLNKITNAKSDTGSYQFTTLSAVPGMMSHKNAKIQIIDVPGIVSGAASGKGRGKEVMGIIRNADLILILIDANSPQHYKAILKEVNETGVRINQRKPDVKITKKEKGGINIGTTVKLTKIDNQTIYDIAREMKLNNAEILIRTDITPDQLIDIIEDNKIYTRSITVVSKIDLVSEQEIKKIKESINPDVMISATEGKGIDQLKDSIFQKLELIRIYLKEVNKKPDLEEPLIIFKDSSIKDICTKLHKDFIKNFRFARVWGPSAKFDGQVFRKLDHVLKDKDILELHIK